MNTQGRRCVAFLKRCFIIQIMNTPSEEMEFAAGNTRIRNPHVFDIDQFSSVLAAIFISQTLCGLSRELSLYGPYRRLTSLFTRILLLRKAATRIVCFMSCIRTVYVK